VPVWVGEVGQFVVWSLAGIAMVFFHLIDFLQLVIIGFAASGLDLLFIRWNEGAWRFPDRGRGVS
jgi:hypothetical protein